MATAFPRLLRFRPACILAAFARFPKPSLAVPPAAESRLSQYLALAYAGALLLGSLYPWTGWRMGAGTPFGFLAAGWPRELTTFDLLTNFLAYLPLGFLIVLTRRRGSRVVAALGACAAGSLLSFSIEATQQFLPSRVPSLADWCMNSLGAAMGAGVGMRYRTPLANQWRARGLQCLHLPRPCADFGILLVILWLACQLAVENHLLASGLLRPLLPVPALWPFSAAHQPLFEMLVVASHTLAILSIASILFPRRPPWAPPALLLLGLACKGGAFLILMPSAGFFAWATMGTLAGLGLGFFGWLLAQPLAFSFKQTLAAVALIASTLLLNLMPENPYHLDALRSWSQGPYFNFNGLMRFLAAFWPYFALFWLMRCRSQR
ncbi:MAG: VanZ family protein [Rhodocyclaceae bacterium]|nr:VanZ family protein [Rhodocyclaceae bacterium]